ncbi:hypothetical protein KR222_004649 [Zaprionus bogoriensis]|nr:hypothetical protein KR222_004649 [Zaprionus bogoriensis]
MGIFRGNTKDRMRVHENQKFTTFDMDNDQWQDNNCAIIFHSGWWYNNCAEW